MGKKILLAFPYHQLSGVPILFSRLARELRRLNQQVVIVDFKDGALNSLTENLDIERIFFVTGQNLIFDENQTVIMQASSLEYIRPEYKFHPKTKLLFWHLHPDNLKLNKVKVFKNHSDFKKFRRPQLNKLGKFVHLIHEKNGLISMDETNFNETNRYHDTDLEVPICPILIGEHTVTEGPSLALTRWAYFGRIEGFKTNAIKKLIYSISEYNAESDAYIELFIIGDGDDLQDLLKETRSLNLRITSLGVVRNHEIAAVFAKYNISTVFAMGTAILDSMKAGCAVIKLDWFNFQTDLYPNYKLKVDEPSHCLGKEISTSEMQVASNLTDLFKRLEEDFTNIISNQRLYLLEYFDDTKNTKKFLKYATRCELKAIDISKYLKRNIIRKIYHYLKYQLYE